MRIYLFLLLTLVLASCNNFTPTDDSQKEASSHTKALHDELLGYLPFGNSTDSINAHKGFIATLEDTAIYNDSDSIVYNLVQYDFIEGDAPDVANPSLWRQSKLNRLHGLFKVRDSVYQIRGFDLANMTLIMGEKGWIVIDPLGSPETAKAGLDLAHEHLADIMGGRTEHVSGIIITHSHIDHFGGIQAAYDERLNNRIPIVVPKGFFEEAVSENVMAGTTMGRRASYMYGNILEKDEKGTVGTGLGQTTSTGMASIMDGTDEIDHFKPGRFDIDGVHIKYIYTPESEAPAEMMFYFPDLKTFCQSEDLNHTLHNLYTLRGAKVRNGQKWSQYIDYAIKLWGDSVEYSFGSHHWPTWGNDAINTFWEGQRDLYRFIHDQTLRLANNGYTPVEIAEMLKLPPALDTLFANRGYYGSVSHNVRAQYQLYFGWFDGNPSNLHRLPPRNAGAKYVELIGRNKIMKKGHEALNEGEYRWVAELLNHLVMADPDDQEAKNLLADAYEQLGYQAESGPWRNFYLSGAKELRFGVKVYPTPNTAGADVVAGMSEELLLNYISMTFKGSEQAGYDMDYVFQINFSDNDLGKGKRNVLIVKNGSASPRINSKYKGDDLTGTITMKRADLNSLIVKDENFNSIDDIVQEGSTGVSEFKAFLGQLDQFEFWFNIVTSNVGAKVEPLK